MENRRIDGDAIFIMELIHEGLDDFSQAEILNKRVGHGKRLRAQLDKLGAGVFFQVAQGHQGIDKPKGGGHVNAGFFGDLNAAQGRLMFGK